MAEIRSVTGALLLSSSHHFISCSSIRTHHGIRRTKEMKRFMLYSLYAWGFPFIMVCFVVLFFTYFSISISNSNKNMLNFLFSFLLSFIFISCLVVHQTLFTFMVDFYDVLPDKLRPNIGKTKCWFESNLLILIMDLRL